MTDVKRNRPPFILAIMADAQGCGFHRIQVPLASMVAAEVADGRIDMALWPDDVLLAAAPDAIVVQRQVDDNTLDTFERWKQMLPSTLFVYELDDYLGKIPPASYHAGFMPPDIPKKVARAVAIFDRVTTTTPRLADWFRDLGAKDVRVVPNAISVEKIKAREPRQGGKLRIGFAGGMSHAGDLRIIEPAMEAIGDEAEWVFFGTRPDGAKSVRIEYHEGLPPVAYMDKLLKLDTDLMLAPLEDNEFNRCKSNLRLVETGAMGASVIAQDMEPYRLGSPPVFGYATTPEEWIAQIREFMQVSVAERRRSAAALQAWVGRHYVLERTLKDRMDAWLPDGEKWKPVARLPKHGPVVVASFEQKELILERMPFLKRANIRDNGLEEACERALAEGADVLWLRPETNFSEKSWDSMTSALKQSTAIASVLPLTSDGTNAFPKTDEWIPMSRAAVACVESILKTKFPNRRLAINAPSGPCVLLSGSALAMLGIPDVNGCKGNEEQAIMEWGLRAAMREWKHSQAIDAYAASTMPPAQAVRESALRLQARGTATRLQIPSEAFTKAERESIELEMLRQQWAGPRPGSMGFGSDYMAWKRLTSAMNTVPEKAPYTELYTAPTLYVTGFGIGMLPFGWIIQTDDSIELDDNALEHFRRAIAKAKPEVEVIYADHDTKTLDGKLSPEFKPDFDRELFFAQDYITPLCAIRRPRGPLPDRLALYAHIVDVALKHGAKAFAHIPIALGSMKAVVKPEELALEALQRQVILTEKIGDTATISPNRRIPGCLSIVYDWKPYCAGRTPLVSIVVPTLGSGKLIQPCVNTIRQNTAYPNYEIIVVQNGPMREPELGEARDDPRVKVVRWEGGFNWSAINNWAIRLHAKGDYIVTMNDDICVLAKEWLDNMMGRAVCDDIGCVGAKMVHPMGFIQHIGVVAHTGIAAHVHKGLPNNGQAGHMGKVFISHEVSAVTGACMLFSRDSFNAINGFDETMPKNYNDTDFCMRLRNLGLRNVMEMTAEMLHPEGTSRDCMSPKNLQELPGENRAFAKKYPDPDPYWNPNLMLEQIQGGIMIRGLNCDVLAWHDKQPVPGQEKILLINDLPGEQGRAIDVLKAGDIPMGADLSGFKITVIAPFLRNTDPWDVRSPVRMEEGLRALGVTKIVLRSLVGMQGAAPPVESLRCLDYLKSSGFTVDIDAWSNEVVCPWVDETWQPETSQFGNVDIQSWKTALKAFSSVSRPGEHDAKITAEADETVG